MLGIASLSLVASMLVALEVAQVVSAPLAAAASLSDGSVTTLAGSGLNATVAGMGPAASFASPQGVAYSGGYVYVGDSDGLARVATADGTTTVLTTTVTNAFALATDGSNVFSVAANQSAISDTVISTGATTTLTSLPGVVQSFTLGSDGYLYATSGTAVYKQSPSSGAISTVTTFPSSEGVYGIATDGSGNAFVVGVDSSTSVTRIAKVVLSSGTISTLVADGKLPGGGGSSLYAQGGYLYVGTATQAVLRRYSVTGGADSISAGSGNSAHADGVGAKAWLTRVAQVTGDGTNLYAADSFFGSGGWVRKIAPGTALPEAQPASVAKAVAVNYGSVTTLSGSGVYATGGGTGGPNGTAAFAIPVGGVYLNGFLYIGDNANVDKVNAATGAMTVVAGGCSGTCPTTALVGTAVMMGTVFAEATDGTFVYATQADGDILRFDPATTAVSIVGRMPDGASNYLALGPDKALYTTVGPYIDRMSLVDGTSRRFATLPVTTGNPNGTASLSGITADGTYLYSVGSVDNGAGGTSQQIYKVNIGSGAYTVGAPSTDFWAGSLTLAGGQLYLQGPGHSVVSVDAVSGAVAVVAGGTFGYADDSGPAAEFRTVGQVISDGFSLYVPDTNNNRIRAIRGAPPALPDSATYGGCSCNNSLGMHTQSTRTRSDPVDTATGAFSKAMTDVAFPGVGEALKFQRTYTSADSTAGRLGVGWTDTYQASLSVDGSGNVTVRSENGAQGVWTHNSNGTYTPPVGAYSALVSVGGGGWTLTTPDQHTLTFNAAGQLTKMLDAHNKGLTFGYTGSVQTSITDAASRTITLGYTGGLLTSLTLPDGRKVIYAYTNNRLTKVTPLGGHPYTFGYDSNGLLATETDALSHLLFTNTYDPTTLRVATQVDGNGNTTTFGWIASTQTATVTDPDGGVWKDVYARNTLLRTVDPAGGYTYYGYDVVRNLVETQDPLGHVVWMSYDAAGNMLISSRLGASGGALTTYWTYNSLGEPLTAIDPMTYQTTFTYNAAGDRLSTQDPTLAKTTWTWNPDGTMATMVDPRGNVAGCGCAATYTTTYGYDPDGNQTSVTSPLGEKTSYGYDADGRLASTVDARGNVAGCGCAATYTTTRTYNTDDQLHTLTDANNNTTTDNYDDAGRLSGTTNAALKTTSFGYDLNGNTTTATDPLTHASTTTYDWAGHATKIVDADGHVTTHTYDKLGRLATTTDPRGNVTGATAANYTTTYGYDADGNLTTVSRPISTTVTATTTTGYDAFNRVIKVTDPNGHSTSTAYDNDGRISSTTDGNGKTTAYSDDQDGRVLTVKDPNLHVTTYAYDPGGRVLTRKDPDLRVTTNTYDLDGQLKTTTSPDSPALTTTYGYDPAGHQTSISYSDGTTPNVTVGYDPAGRPTTMTDGTGTTTTGYDTLNRVTSVTNGANAVVGYGYNDADQLTSLTYPGNRTVSYGLTGGGTLHTITDWNTHTTTVGYDPADELTSLAYPNGVTATYTDDQAGRLTAITDKLGATTLASYAYTYDKGSRMLSDKATITGQAADNRAYSYTNADQLKTDSTGTYTQDPANQLTATPAGNGTATAQAYEAAGQLTSGTLAGVGNNYTFNARGDRTTITPTSGTATSLAYDQADALTSWTQGATTVGYSYDGGSRQMTRTSGGTTTHNVWDSMPGTPALLEDGTNSYLYGPTGPLEQINDTTGATVYLQQDHLGSTKLLTDPSGVNVGTYRYDAYGNPSHTGTASTPLQYAGEPTDPTTGYQNLNARWYDPVTGQFLTVDPLASVTGTPYAYGANNPIMNTDPSGQLIGKILKFAGGEAVGAFKTVAHMAGAAAKAAIDPVATIEGIIKACSDGFDQYYGDNIAGGLKCIDNLNPIAAIRTAAVTCWHIAEQSHDYQAGQKCGEALTEATAILAGGADGAAPLAGDLEPAEVASDSEAEQSVGAVCGGQSFAPETEVVMADGSTKRLTEVKVGDKVEATDVATGKTSAQTVTKVWVNHDNDLMDVTVRAGGVESVIHATQHHRFWDGTRGAWVQARRLTAGDQLRTDDGTVATVVDTGVVAGAADMWDLTVSNDHDFYVVTHTSNILVHNCSGSGESGAAEGSPPLDGLAASGKDLDPTDAGGQLTRAGRAYAKAGEVFGRTSGGPAAINEAGQQALEEILTNPDTKENPLTKGNFAGGYRFAAPNGTFAVFGPDGTFQYFGK